MSTPLISVIVPAYNGGDYLLACIESILSQDWGDCECLVSDDHSTDGTVERLAALDDPRLKVVSPPYSMSMAEHWEWAFLQSRGRWIIFVGQDDGLQPYFFTLASELIQVSEREGLRAVNSGRAYVFWPGYPGSDAVLYSASRGYRIRSVQWQVLGVLLGVGTYFDLPQGYTTSLVRRDLLQEAIHTQGGHLFQTHPQDANLAAIVSALNRRYVFSHVPLGWVGSSPKSAGLAVVSAESLEQQALKAEYLRRVERSALRYSERIGSFSYGSLVLYFWGAVLMTGRLRHPSTNRILSSKVMALLVLCATLARKEGSLDPQDPRYSDFSLIVHANGLSVAGLARFYRRVFAPAASAIGKGQSFFARVGAFVAKQFPSLRGASFGFSWNKERRGASMMRSASAESEGLFKQHLSRRSSV